MHLTSVTPAQGDSVSHSELTLGDGLRVRLLLFALLGFSKGKSVHPSIARWNRTLHFSSNMATP